MMQTVFDRTGQQQKNDTTAHAHNVLHAFIYTEKCVFNKYAAHVLPKNWNEGNNRTIGQQFHCNCFFVSNE